MNRNRMPSQRGGEDECCGKCKYHCYMEGGYYCDNEDSDNYLSVTPYDYECMDFEPKRR